jgi:hypothetical protein
MQGNWAADGTAEGGGRQCTRAGGRQLLAVAGEGALKTYSKSYLKIVPQIVQKNPRKNRFSEEVFARFEVRFDVRQIVPQIVPVFVCDRTGLKTFMYKGYLSSDYD